MALLASNGKHCTAQIQFWTLVSLSIVEHIYMWQKLNLKISQTPWNEICDNQIIVNLSLRATIPMFLIPYYLKNITVLFY